MEREIIVVGDLFEENGHGSAAGRVYSGGGIAPALGASHFQQEKWILEVRDEKHRSGREDGQHH